MEIDNFKRRLSRVVSNLKELGYIFSNPSDVVCGPVSISKFKELESMVGPLPKLLVDFYSQIGGVNLIGHHPDWDSDLYADPLYLSPFDYFLERAEVYASNLGNL